MQGLVNGSNQQEQSLPGTFFKTRPLIPISFAMIFVFFFFGFADFRCNGVTVASVSGYDLVFGKHVRSVAGNYTQATGVPEQLITDPSSGDGVRFPYQGDWIKPNTWAILSLAAAIIGLFIFLKGGVKDEEKLGIALSLFGFISLIILGIVIESKTRQQSENVAPVDVGFRAAYWLCLTFFSVALTVCYLRLKERLHERIVFGARVISKINVFIATSPNLLKKDS